MWGFDYTPLKLLALTEPLVDTVELKACVTDPCKVFEIDLYTVRVEDLAFRAPFTLKARRSDFIHALIAWFDIEFAACHKPIRFSTGPHAKYTHWKQTVFYMKDILTIEDGEQIIGYLSSKPNAVKKRDQDITIDYQFEPMDMVRQSQAHLDFKM